MEDKCPTCGGTGWIEIAEDDEGMYVIPVPCPTCNPDGKISIND